MSECNLFRFEIQDLPPIGECKNIDHDSRLLAVMKQNQFVSHRGTLTSSSGAHGLIHACHVAFQRHMRFELSVVDVATIVNQAISTAVNIDAEKYRSLLVSHSNGQIVLQVQRQEWMSLSADKCNWPDAFQEMADKVRSNMPIDLATNMLANYSVSTDDSRMASYVAVMNTTSTFYKYQVFSMCGLIGIVLRGTLHDWCDLRSRIVQMQLNRFGLQHYVPQLLAFVDECIKLAQGVGNKTFWRDLYQEHESSGFNGFSGNIQMLLAFRLVDQKAHPLIYESNSCTQFSQCDTGVSVANFTWLQNTNSHSMQIVAGFGDPKCDENTRTVSVTQGWAVVQTHPSHNN